MNKSIYTHRPNSFGNLLRKELQAWWGTPTWIIQTMLWLLITAGMTVMAMLSGANAPLEVEPLKAGLGLFGMSQGLFGTIGLIVLTHNSLLGEIERGSAAWVLTKPTSRAEFFLAKFAAHALGVGVSIVLAAGLAVFAFVRAQGHEISILSFVQALGLVFLYQLMYLALTLTLSVWVRTTAAGVGLGIGLLFVGLQIAQQLPPQVLASLPIGAPFMFSSVALGEWAPSAALLAGTLMLIGFLLSLGIWLFKRKEL
jgi:ABC-2 type transport system permease protein